MLQGVQAGYGAARVLDGLSFTLAPGASLALIGRNGAGKTTTLKAILGLVTVTGGRISWGERVLTGLPPHRIARLGIGWVPEERRIFTGLSVLENLMVGQRAGGADTAAPWTIARVLALFPALAERRRHLGGQLSGGEQQMLAIGRTLMGNPRLMLLDEPSEGLAPVVVEQLQAALAGLRQGGMAMVLAEQNLALATALCDRVLVLEQGQRRFLGTAAALNADPERRDQWLALG